MAAKGTLRRETERDRGEIESTNSTQLINKFTEKVDDKFQVLHKTSVIKKTLNPQKREEGEAEERRGEITDSFSFSFSYYLTVGQT